MVFGTGWRGRALVSVYWLPTGLTPKLPANGWHGRPLRLICGTRRTCFLPSWEPLPLLSQLSKRGLGSPLSIGELDDLPHPSIPRAAGMFDTPHGSSGACAALNAHGCVTSQFISVAPVAPEPPTPPAN